MTKITCRFDIHPVGQGLFYTGRVNDYHFVYDCGTDSGTQYSQVAVDNCGLAETPLDLLIISHFHADHMNAVKALLTRTKGIKRVILPYLFPAERLMAAAGYAIANDLDGVNDEYVAFLADPVEYLRGNGADDATFTLLRPEEAVNDWPNPQGQSAGEYGWYPDDPLDKADVAELAQTPQFVELREHSSIYRVPLWGFKFYCQPGRASAADIRKQLASLTPPIDVADIPRVLRDRLDDLKDVYHALFDGSAGQNSTSVVCCHGPAAPRGNGDHPLHGEARVCLSVSLPSPAPTPAHWSECLCGHCFFDWHGWWHRLGNGRFLLPPLQLLTGDANLKPKEFQTHFAAELDAIGLVLLPHHGSKHNWRKGFPKMMPNCQLWVASFGLGNRHKHPSKAVVDAVVAANRQLQLSNEVQHVAIAADGWRWP